MVVNILKRNSSCPGHVQYLNSGAVRGGIGGIYLPPAFAHPCSPRPHLCKCIHHTRAKRTQTILVFACMFARPNNTPNFEILHGGASVYVTNLIVYIVKVQLQFVGDSFCIQCCDHAANALQRVQAPWSQYECTQANHTFSSFSWQTAFPERTAAPSMWHHIISVVLPVSCVPLVLVGTLVRLDLLEETGGTHLVNNHNFIVCSNFSFTSIIKYFTKQIHPEQCPGPACRGPGGLHMEYDLTVDDHILDERACVP